ncbi:ABC transporter permease subunit/CPBP intramembrane protease [Lignipirellula cremea]|uniref:ABC-2 family transporter protein n=1 Tax=Lignipirellula cremea TaxID=2528010 RepID=A0A518DVW0_9BACT|nr:ABC transporter permease subunit/CPBP intramembrane protease [Lignipirellula cremea]QDU95969.1 ABC-2 family transporter protein [Lignipirellula cremea]
MNWSNVRLIFHRELRDQLRDRRTVFTIAVLPLLLYPLMGMAMLQVSQFRRDHPSQVWLIGAAGLPDDPLLVGGESFAPSVCTDSEAEMLAIKVSPTLPVGLDRLEEMAETAIRNRSVDAIVYFPPNFGAELNRFRFSLKNRDGADEVPLPEPVLFVDSANDKSRMAAERAQSILNRWRAMIVNDSLRESSIPVAAASPFNVVNSDVAHEVSRRAAFWSKVLPFVVLIWALTGAFYPAIDLCAGEKERGTLETLLSSPAGRNEIVMGKLLTIMTFSMTTSLLNMISMGATGSFIFQHMQQASGMSAYQIGPPPLVALGWLVLALIPISALFSALSLAIAAFARSAKEGQYYLMPLMVASLPLMLLPMLPAAELDLGSSLIPVTGVMLLLRSLMEGQFREALPFAPVVVSVTAVCCVLAIRWAIDQFQNESVIFRESERWGLGLWLRHLMRDRDETPTFGEAILCGVLLLLIRFFAGFMAGMPQNWYGFAGVTIVTLVALIATPVLLMTIMLTRSPAKTLNLTWPKWKVLAGAGLLAALLHPAGMAFSHMIHELYPFSGEVAKQLGLINQLVANAPHFWMVLVVMALLPAICEELAFRGFILSGLRHMGHKWAAIVISSLFFGAAHGILQQSMSACLVGMVLGYLVVQTGSLWTGVIFHFVYNSLSLTLGLRGTEVVEALPALSWVLEPSAGAFGYHWAVTLAATFLGVLLLLWFRSLPYQATAEEKLKSALHHQTLQGSH